MGTYTGEKTPYNLAVIAINGNTLFSIDNLDGIYCRWAPDEKSIWYTKGGKLLTTTIAEKDTKVIMDLEGIPINKITWVPEGK